MASASKKSLRAAERKRADVARARRRWIREQGWLDTTRLVFIDETAVTTNMVRLNGWNPRGERLFADAPMGHWETVTFIAGLRQTGIVAPMLIKGAMNGEAFLAYVEQCLAPTLKRGDIVVVDNVPFHKVAGVEQAIRAVGASLRYLPQYSPDLTPSSWCSILSRLSYARLPSEQSRDCTDASGRTFGRSILLNVVAISGIQAMTHYERDAL